MREQIRLDLSNRVLRGKDIFLCHTGADKAWVEHLAERIEGEPYQDRYLGVIFDKWDFAKASNIVLDIEREIDACRFVGVVISKAALAADWPTLERTIAVWSDPSGARGRVIPILRENVTLPPSLRIRNWIDFRDDTRFEEALAELVRLLRGESAPRGRGSLLPVVPVQNLPYEPAPVVITSSCGADVVQERLVCNLFPVVQVPRYIYSAETHLRDKAAVDLACNQRNLPAFILKQGKLSTFSPLARAHGPFRPALQEQGCMAAEKIEEWLRDEDRHRWVVELLNVSLRKHAWDAHLRFENNGKRYFYAPQNNWRKRLWWNLGGKRRPRTVTAKHMGFVRQTDGTRKEVQVGWRHQGFRAKFVHLPCGLFLQMEPTWLLTEMDGKTPKAGPNVGPILVKWLNQERNGQVLRSVRFWSLVLAGGRKSIEISTEQGPIEISLTPSSGSLGFGILGDRLDYDELMRAEVEDDKRILQLDLFELDPDTLHEEEDEDEAAIDAEI
jgi:hypothetical protein